MTRGNLLLPACVLVLVALTLYGSHVVAETGRRAVEQLDARDLLQCNRLLTIARTPCDSLTQLHERVCVNWGRE